MQNLEFKIQPWAHQLDGIERARSMRDFAFFFDMGTGKTATTINTIRHRYYEQAKVLKTLVLCPPVVCENWAREFDMHSWVGNKCLVLDGSGTERLAKLKEFSHEKPIVITNYEALLMEPVFNFLKKWQPEILVCDESQKIKAHNSKRTKLAAKLAKDSLHNYILSGTPILNSAQDIFGQFLVLDRGETFSTNFTGFKHRFFFDANAGMPSHKYFPSWEPRADTAQILNQLIYKKAMRVEKKTCMTLPPLVRTVINVPLSPKQQKAYAEMRKNFITFLNGEAVTAQLAITKALRLSQIVSGFVKTENDEEISFQDVPRLKALDEILENLNGQKVIIWACFHQNYRQIAEVCRKRGLGFAELHGAESLIGGSQKLSRQESIDKFQKDPACTVMIASPQAGGVGVNLTAAPVSIFFSRNFSLENDLQAEARNYRGGSEIHEKVTRIDLCTPNTIDELIMQALKDKVDLSNQILTLKDKL